MSECMTARRIIQRAARTGIAAEILVVDFNSPFLARSAPDDARLSYPRGISPVAFHGPVLR